LRTCLLAAAAEELGEGETSIVVTGTLIKGSREDAPAPVDVIDAEELAAQGSPTMLELTKRLAVSAGVIGDASQFDTRSQFNEGTASVNLRGSARSARWCCSTASGWWRPVGQPAAGRRQPVAERGDCADRGAQGRRGDDYGSDAIAGVVNFITRTDQDGFLAAGDYRWVDGSEGDWNGALSWGGDSAGAAVRLGRLPAPRRADHARPRLLVPELPGEPAGRMDRRRRAGELRLQRDRRRRALRRRRRLRGGRRVPLAARLDRRLVPSAVSRLHQSRGARGSVPAVRRRGS
jgi:hypothetical protein